MKITRISVYQIDLPLEHPYWLSGGRLDTESYPMKAFWVILLQSIHSRFT